MTKEEKAFRLQYWCNQGEELFARWQKDNDERTWGAFCCCVACAGEFDKKLRNPKAQKINALAWKYGWLKGEVTLEKWQESGCFDEQFFEKFSKNT